MQRNDNIIKKWFDYRIECEEMAKKHTQLVWGRMGEYEYDYQIQSTDRMPDIQLFISQYAGKTRRQIFGEIAEALGVSIEPYKDSEYMCFKYRGYIFFCNIEYDKDMMIERQRLGLEDDNETRVD